MLLICESTKLGVGGNILSTPGCRCRPCREVIGESAGARRRIEIFESVNNGGHKVNLANFKESAAFHAECAAMHQAKADELKAGDKKDAHQEAADKHTKAANLAKAAFQASNLANAYESDRSNQPTLSEADLVKVEGYRALGFSEAEARLAAGVHDAKLDGLTETERKQVISFQKLGLNLAESLAAAGILDDQIRKIVPEYKR
jgi:hypothetical protein